MSTEQSPAPETRVVRLHRLKHPTQFQAVMAGPPVGKTPHFALHLLRLPQEGGANSSFPVQAPWLGVVVPKRWAKRAVTRNTIRRQIHELARLQHPPLPDAAMVVRLRSEFSRKQFVSATSDVLKAAVRAELVQLLAKAARLAQPAHAQGVARA
ncbi:ribonuclease P protein component [Hydrogenophaga soli]